MLAVDWTLKVEHRLKSESAVEIFPTLPDDHSFPGCCMASRRLLHHPIRSAGGRAVNRALSDRAAPLWAAARGGSPVCLTKRRRSGGGG